MREGGLMRHATAAVFEMGETIPPDTVEALLLALDTFLP